jgi:hypothetical protein
MNDGKPFELVTPGKVQKCGFSRLSPLTGNCKDCGDPQDPTTKGYCTICAISHGIEPRQPITPATDAETEQK